MNKIISLFFLVFFISCQQNQEISTNKYYDIKGYFINQINNLLKEKHSFIKVISINSETESKVITNINWANEMEPFVQADINKPAYLGLYNTTVTDSTIYYLLKPDEKLAIKSILIKKNPRTELIKFIEVKSEEENMLYRWQKLVSAQFNEGKLASYCVEGSQKMLIFNEEKYKITGTRK